MSVEESVPALLDDLSSRPVREDLSPVREALDQLGAPVPDTVVQVVGSNGKGSFVHYLSSALSHLQSGVLSYTSPHFNHPAERYQFNGSPVSRSMFEEAIENVDNNVAMELTPFEALFLTAVQLGKEFDPSCLILEAGMGGRWDATSALPADLTVLTSVELEHRSFLGESLEEITREKTAQLPRGSILVSGVHQNPVSDVVNRRVSEKNLRCSTVSPEGTVTERLRRLAAVAGAEITGRDRSIFAQFLNDVEPPPGRGESVLFNDRRFLLDVAHTPGAVDTVFEEKIPDADGKIYTVFGCLQGKDAHSMLRRIRRTIPPERLALVEPPSDRSLSLNEMPDDIEFNSTMAGHRLPETFESLVEETNPGDLIVVLGSFDLVGWFRDRLGD